MRILSGIKECIVLFLAGIAFVIYHITNNFGKKD